MVPYIYWITMVFTSLILQKFVIVFGLTDRVVRYNGLYHSPCNNHTVACVIIENCELTKIIQCMFYSKFDDKFGFIAFSFFLYQRNQTSLYVLCCETQLNDINSLITVCCQYYCKWTKSHMTIVLKNLWDFLLSTYDWLCKLCLLMHG